MDEQVEKTEADTKKELTDAEILEMWSPRKIRAEFDALDVTPGWKSFFRTLVVINIIALVLFFVIARAFLTVTGPAAIGLIVLLGPMVMVLVVAAINVIGLTKFIQIYHPKGSLFSIIMGAIILSAALLFWVFFMQ